MKITSSADIKSTPLGFNATRNVRITNIATRKADDNMNPDMHMIFDGRLLPVEEIVRKDEFAGRVKELREFDKWFSETGRVGGQSTAIIAPRRMGKTVFLDRLVNIVFFKPEYKVAPFYIKFKREITTLRKFLLVYASEFFRQFIAYCLQDASLFRRENLKLENLLKIKTEHESVLIAKEHIQEFLERYEESNQEDTRNHWDYFVKVPEIISVSSGIKVGIVIDEFQDMKFYVHDTTEENLNKLQNEYGEKIMRSAINLPATFSYQAASRKAPMLVSGSAVTIIFETTMGGPLGGRFGFKYIKPLSIVEGADLLTKLVKIHEPEQTLSADTAIYASTQVTGHPYYLYCLATSDSENKVFETKEQIDILLDYEIKHGKIYGFWNTHFSVNRDIINNDNNEEIGKKIIYMFTKYNNQPIDIPEIANTLSIDAKVVEEKIEKLRQADLVYLTGYKKYTFNDICLMRYIQNVYEHAVSEVDKIDICQQERYNVLKGRFLELVTSHVLLRASGHTISKEILGIQNDVIFPHFSWINTMQVKAQNTDSYQIDVVAKENPPANRYYLCECKYKKTKMTMTDVKKLEKAKNVFLKSQRKMHKSQKQEDPQIILWYLSSGGFNKNVIDYLKTKENVYFSDYTKINKLFRDFGSGYDILVE